MNEIPVAGIDVSKAFSDMCILAPNNTVHSKTKILHDLPSLERSLLVLQDAERKYGSKPVIIMEATAHYHRLIMHFMQQAGYEVVVINPLQSGALKNINIRKIKNDRIDAHRIAQLYRLKTIKPTSMPTDVICDLRELCRQRADLVEDQTAYTNRLTALLDQSFPGYAEIFSRITALSSLGLLAKYPTPADILATPKEDLVTFVGELAHRGKVYGAKKAVLLISAAETAMKLGIHRPSMGILIQSIVSMLQTLQNEIGELEYEIGNVAKACPTFWHNVELLVSIPGVGFLSATVILAEIGDITAFKKPKQLVAFFGLDPSQRQSGAFTGTKNRISKRGSRYLRGILNMVTHAAIHPCRSKKIANPVLSGFYLKKLENKAPKSAFCAAMHKMVNIIFAVLRDQKPFELRTPEEHVRIMRGTDSQQVAAA